MVHDDPSGKVETGGSKMSDQFDYLTDVQRRKLRLRQISNDRDLADMLSDERNRTRVQNLLELSEDSLTEVLSTLEERHRNVNSTTDMLTH